MTDGDKKDCSVVKVKRASRDAMATIHQTTFVSRSDRTFFAMRVSNGFACNII